MAVSRSFKNPGRFPRASVDDDMFRRSKNSFLGEAGSLCNGKGNCGQAGTVIKFTSIFSTE
jgi:hypothetical protein